MKPLLVPALLAAVGLPAWSAVAQDGGVSDLVYPPASPRIRAVHDDPAHRALRCRHCHASAAESERAEDILMPAEKSCTPCHGEQINRATSGACATCHLGGTRPFPIREPVETRMQFSHRAHARRGVRCLTCHGQTRPERAMAMPTMASCVTCHDGVGASGECTLCHVALPDGRMRARFAEGELTPPAWMDGMAHDRDWLVRHRWVAADRGDRCASCHAESDCVACHDGREPPPRVHPGDFMLTHPQSARRDAHRCASCHTTQTFCAECHSRVGVSPMASPQARARGRFHPSGPAWRGAAGHGREARRSMGSCASCHAERDCVTCHAERGIGAGFTPHGPRFAAECARLLAENDRACRQCHSDPQCP